MSGPKSYGPEIRDAARKAGFLLGRNLATGSVRVIDCPRSGVYCPDDPDRFTDPAEARGWHRHHVVLTWPYEAALAWLQSPAAEEWKRGGVSYTDDDAAKYSGGGHLVGDVDQVIGEAEAGGPW